MKIKFADKSNIKAPVDENKQITSDNINEIKKVINAIGSTILEFKTKTELLQKYPNPDSNAFAKVTNDGANNGYYSVVSGSWVPDGKLVAQEVYDEITENLNPLVDSYHTIGSASFLKEDRAINLYDFNKDVEGRKLSPSSATSVVASNCSHSEMIPISSLRSYYLGAFPLKYSTFNALKVIAFLDKNKQYLADYGWGYKNLYQPINDAGGLHSIYKFIPEEKIAADWKTNGRGELPLPREAAFVEFNTKVYISLQTYNLKSSLVFSELTVNTAYKSKLKSVGSELSILLQNFLKKGVIANKFNKERCMRNKYVNGLGKLATANPVGDLHYWTSEYIDVEGSSVWHLSGRNSQDKGNASHSGIAFFDKDFNPLAPLREDGGNYFPYDYAPPLENGLIFKPSTAKYCVFNALFKADKSTLDDIMFVPYFQKLDEYLKYGEIIPKDFLQMNPSVLDGQFLVKKGDSFTGVDLKIDSVDGIYRVINYLASEIQKTRVLEFRNLLEPLQGSQEGIYMYEDELYWKKNGVTKKIALL